jgi:formimidoylglutamate deiminase
MSAMQTVTFAHLWVDGAWQTDVTVEIDGGRVVGLRAGAGTGAGKGAGTGAGSGIEPGPQYVAGLTLPGLADAHCHAFQRLLAPWTQRARTAREQTLPEDFWTWRELMYAAAMHLGPEELEAVAARCYLDLLRGGYSAVAEFLYLHRLPADGAKDPRPLNADRAIAAAARRAGMRLLLLPTLYQHADFGGATVTPGQVPFQRSAEQFLQDWEALKRRYAQDPAVWLGVGFHSLRAVDVDTVAQLARSLAADAHCRVFHMHVAEQSAEVTACLAHHGRRPVTLLMERELPGARWALVHAIHTTATELRQLARSGAALVSCPTTEADLGDGYADVGRFLAAGGQLAIGSDSNIGCSAYAELRTLEWGLRQREGRRNVTASAGEPAVADRLYRAVRTGGWRALGQPEAGAPGASADFVTFDAQQGDWSLVPPEQFLSALVFGCPAPRAHEVMVGGQWIIRDGVHREEAQIEQRYREALLRLQEPLRQALARGADA